MTGPPKTELWTSSPGGSRDPVGAPVPRGPVGPEQSASAEGRAPACTGEPAPSAWRRWTSLGALVLGASLWIAAPAPSGARAPGAAPTPTDRGDGPALRVGETVQLVGEDRPSPPPGWSVRAPAERPPHPFVGPWRLPRYELAPAARLALAGLGGPTADWGLGAGHAPRARGAGAGRGLRSAPVNLPPPYAGFLGRPGAPSWVDGVDYADPVGAGLPLLRARGYEDLRISTHFRVQDFATRDGAPYLRVAPALVDGLERIQTIVGSVTVISGYRHPRYNALPTVGGARYSRHQSGQAADVWSATATTPEMARAAIAAMGCAIGIGLGQNTIHVDVRGYLETWTYPRAPMSAYAFDRWVRALCGGAAVAPPPTPSWRTEYESHSEDGGEVVHGDGDALQDAVEDATTETARPTPEAASPPSTERTVARKLSGFVRQARSNGARGVVVIGLGPGETVETVPLEDRARYVLEGSPELRRLGLADVVGWARARLSGEVFVYAIRRADGGVDLGVAPLVDPRAPAERARADWFVVLGTYALLAEAEAALADFGRALRPSGLGPVLLAERGPEGPRYSAVVGPFGTEADARRASAQAGEALPPRWEVRRSPVSAD